MPVSDSLATKVGLWVLVVTVVFTLMSLAMPRGTVIQLTNVDAMNKRKNRKGRGLRVRSQFVMGEEHNLSNLWPSVSYRRA